MKDAPAFDFYPERWLVGTAAMTDAEQLAYLRLLCHQWTMDGLPEDVPILRRLAGKGVTENVLAKFPLCDGKRRNARLESVRQEQRQRIIKSREKIEKMNAARASTRSSTRSVQDASTRESTRPLLSASSPLTTHPVLLEKEPKAGEGLDLIPEIESRARNPIPETIRLALQPLYGRKPETKWSAKEVATWKKLNLPESQALQDIALFSKARSAGWTFYRRDVETLLNNWQGEVERSQDYLRTNKPSSSTGHAGLFVKKGQC